jgi:hypothetical protein
MGTSGTADDVDRLMLALVAADDLATSRLVDFALSLVELDEGRQRLRDYLFDGNRQQRNYAALYFKRRNVTYFLEEAVAAGKIDAAQAFSH